MLVGIYCDRLIEIYSSAENKFNELYDSYQQKKAELSAAPRRDKKTVVWLAAGVVFSFLTIVLLCSDWNTKLLIDKIFDGGFILLFAVLFLVLVILIFNLNRQQEAEIELMLRYYDAEQNVLQLMKQEIEELKEDYADKSKETVTLFPFAHYYSEALDNIQLDP